MEKELYFAKVDEKKVIENVLDALSKEYNEIIWTEQKEAIDFNLTATKHYFNRRDELEKELTEARESYTKEELKEMSREYRNR
ncbi:hypothetical protein [Priestia megaterium]|uniref:hypothetical protein n=1 Tax=Priestia megaterium TaxID=1404 RepID=UPI000BF7828D|nr:hypothetical protein [Priestia megaterium]PFW43829.1 hypothetical protein COL17_26860 [Priestia megaterium]